MYDLYFTEEQQQLRKTARDFARSKIVPVAGQLDEEGHFPTELLKEAWSLGLMNCEVPEEFGGLGLSCLSHCMIQEEIAWACAGVNTSVAANALAALPVMIAGTREQKEKYLGWLTREPIFASYCCSEPDAGSDVAGLRTHFVKDGDGYILNGQKRWITNGNLADVAIIWAKLDGVIRGFVVDTKTPGFTAQKIERKFSLRASVTSELILEDVEVPESALMPGVEGLKGPLSCLTQARYGIAWGAIGAAEACFECAVDYAKSRKQFSRPIAGYQLVQAKFADMLTEITKAQLVVWRLGRLKEQKKMRPAQVSLAKRNNVSIATDIARETRRLLGGNGILAEYGALRHMANLESVYTYEGTHDVHSLILGQAITGLNAFK